MTTLHREPYRLFMPLGILLAWAGVGHWLLHSLGVLPEYRPIFHAMTQVQGFLLLFAVGFLFTMIPRRTGSFPATTLEMVLAGTGPFGTVVSAWLERWALSQTFFLVTAFTLLVFLLRRGRRAASQRRPPVGFVWLPVAFLIGVWGAVLAGAGGILGHSYWWLHQLGQRLVLQGMFLGLFLGVGSLAIPLMTRGEAPADSTSSRRDRWIRAGHLLAAGLLLLSFWIEQRTSVRAGFTLRFVVLISALILGPELHRLPSRPGWNRWLIWSAAWMIPAGYLVGALFPEQYKAGLHVTFIGGFALLALAVGVQVILGHSGRESLRDGRPWPVAVLGGLLAGAMVLRGLMDFAPERFFLWMGLSAALFVTGTLIWLAFLLPRMRSVTAGRSRHQNGHGRVADGGLGHTAQ